ncbi:MAG: putative cell surface protein [Labilithrix sp.]|nr:putative cell surface protein [Labilithrix sp.]
MSRLLLRLGSLLLLAAAASCSPASDGAPTDDGAGAPPDTCAAGTMASLETGGCEPVGPSSCATGFARDESGWGCTAILPPAACTGATHAVIGETSCVPIDDCDAPFPPKGATVVHDSAELASVLAVASPGATVALEAGTYGTITTDQDVTLVGRCAAKVIVQGPGARGVFIQQDRHITVRSMTIRGFDGGLVAAYYEPHVDASSLVLEDNKIGVLSGEAHVTLSNSVIRGHAYTKTETPRDIGATVQQAGTIVLDGVEINDASTAFAAYDAPGSIEARRSVVRYDGPAAAADAVMAYRGGAVVLRESAVRLRAAAFAAIGTDLPDLPPVKLPKPGSLRVIDSDIVQSGFDRSDRPLGRYGDRGSVALEGTTFVHQSGVAFLGGESGTSMTFTDSVIRALPTAGLPRVALMALEGTSAKLTRSVIVDAWQTALLAAHPGAVLALDHSLVTGTHFGAASPSGDVGGVSIAITVGDGATFAATDSTISGSAHYALVAENEATVELTRSLVQDTTNDDALGGGVAVTMAYGARLAMQDSVVRSSAGAALLFIEGSAIVQNTRVTRNQVGIHLDGTSLVEVQQPPETSEATQVVFFRNVFSRNVEYERTGPVATPSWAQP